MANPKIKVEGLKELEKALIALQKEYGGKAAPQAMRPAVKAALAPVLDTVKENTPVDTGELRDSAKLKIGVVTKKMKRSHHYDKNTVIAGRVGWFWKGRSLWKKSLAVEYGTREIPATLTLRGAMDNHQQGMLNRFKKTLGTSIEKKAKQLAKKRGK